MIWAVLLEPIPHPPPSLTLAQNEQTRLKVVQIAHAVWGEWTMTDSDVICHVHQSIRCLIFDWDLHLHCTGRLWWLHTAPFSFARHNCRTLQQVCKCCVKGQNQPITFRLAFFLFYWFCFVWSFCGLFVLLVLFCVCLEFFLFALSCLFYCVFFVLVWAFCVCFLLMV